MHIVIAVVTLVGAFAVWYWRIKMAREAGGELMDAADDLRGAVRRLMYKRKHNKHPVDSIDDDSIRFCAGYLHQSYGRGTVRRTARR